MGKDDHDDRGGVNALIEGFAAGRLYSLQPVAPHTGQDLPAIFAAIKGMDPGITLQAICNRLEAYPRVRAAGGQAGSRSR